MSRTPAQLATQLVEAFGRPDDIAAVLADDATWWISPTVPPEIMQSLSTGRDVIRGNMQRVFSVLYDGETMRTVVHSAFGEGNLGTVRFTLSGEFPNGGKYSNEYCVCIETRGDEISKVWEYVDAAHAVIQMQAAGIDISPAGAP
ncbi:nuclear transport factor 2 family protein [[Mycobacterium] burgundiense]|uniref:Nuclear transport factor 2 family protein n=1 Tax=[Mycobacterium] burgundiense TaxID=3064286 RepID=A0ABM9LHS6_9MYCO|nr:nuclear transport factor 2 family protein [Mycolicibacterium sp. MU0053]CAJ1499292.1 nuclear transport factor 2 family protein [Mycolicibacterium sp. MU0053]